MAGIAREQFVTPVAGQRNRDLLARKSADQMGGYLRRIGEGLVVVLLYVVIGLTALAIDRRALLVSALAYVLYALNRLFEELGTVELSVALTALIIGSALLMLSAFWHQARAMVVKPLPSGLRDRLPLVDRAAPIPQPAA
jgi:hypothetical protein